jgi:hypothetical protein
VPVRCLESRSKGSARDMKVLLSRADSTSMYRRAFARHRTGAALLLGLSLRAPSASAEPAEPDETRVGTEAALEVTVRGAAPGVSSYLHHIGFGLSVIHLGSSNRVDLYPGDYLARFGGFAGGAVSAQTRGPEPFLSGEANSSRFDVGGLIEPPFARGRGSLLPALLSLLSPEMKLDYRDHQARATYEPSARDRFSAFGFGSHDLLGEKRNGILRRLGDACRPRITFTW